MKLDFWTNNINEILDVKKEKSIINKKLKNILNLPLLICDIIYKVYRLP